MKGFCIVNKTEIDIFMKNIYCFFDDSTAIWWFDGNLISGSSAFFKYSLNIWKFTVHVLLKPGLENFEHYFTSVWDECNCAVFWLFGIVFLWDRNGNWPFPALWPLLSFPNLWHIGCSTLAESSFKIWSSSIGIPSPPAVLFVVMLPKAHLSSHSRISGSLWVITRSCLSGLWRSLLCSSYIQKRWQLMSVSCIIIIELGGSPWQ